MGDGVVLHELAASCGKCVPERVLDGACPVVWVAHQLRDVQHALEAGDTIFRPGDAGTRADAGGRDPAAQALRRVQESLPVFMSERDVPTTNNVSEQALRLSTVFRKVTNGFRAAWGAELYGGVRTVVATGRRQGLSALAALCATGAIVD